MGKWVRGIGIRLEPMLPKATLVIIGNSPFAYLYESFDGLTRLSIRTFPTRSDPNRFAIVGVAASL